MEFLHLPSPRPLGCVHVLVSTACQGQVVAGPTRHVAPKHIPYQVLHQIVGQSSRHLLHLSRLYELERLLQDQLLLRVHSLLLLEHLYSSLLVPHTWDLEVLASNVLTL